MDTIKFGTDGWRAIIAKEFTVVNVIRVTEAVAQWLLKNHSDPLVIVGHDCRFGGELFAGTVAKVLAHHKIKVMLSGTFTSTPMISLGVVTYKADLGIIITASHNPPEYNGYKLKGSYGGPLLAEKVKDIESLIKVKNNIIPDALEKADDKGLIGTTNLENLYCKHIEKHFDLKRIRKSGISIAYDAMYGAGLNVLHKVLPDAVMLHSVYNPSFGGTAPEPVEKNLTGLKALVKKTGKFDMGFATDGDADRIGLFDARGEFIDANHIILLLIYYMVTYKKMSGKVCVSYTVTEKARTISAHFGLPYQVVKVGFKYICDIMLKEDVLLGGEESGGIALKGHIPERDGIWVGLTILEFMAKTGKSLEELTKEVAIITGKFTYRRDDLHLSEELKQSVLKLCSEHAFTSFGNHKVINIGELDGYKFFMDNEEWFMIRASGTEPILRLYAEAKTSRGVNEIMDAAILAINNG